MPKRIATPPPGDDEPRYLTVVHPYPLHASMELATDRLAFVYWMASCIGRENLYAFFHKPKSPNMVIIEVKRDFQNFNSVLGEHKWSQFLRNPSEEEKTKVSKVFYCTYSIGREVEKYGWKRVFIQDSYYETPDKKPKWLRINDIIMHPYPETRRCEVPAEDKTREPLCRPLPVKVFPPPPPVRPPPVGSLEWRKARDDENALAEKGRSLSGSLTKGNPVSSSKPHPINPVKSVSRGVSNMDDWARGPIASQRGAAAPLRGSAAPPGLLAPGWPSLSVSPSATPSPSSSDTQGPPGLVRRGSSAVALSSGNDSGNPDLWPTSAAVVPQIDYVTNNNIGDAMDNLTIDWDDYEDLYSQPEPQEAPDVPFEDDLRAIPAEPEQLPDREPVWNCPDHKELCKPKLCSLHDNWLRERRKEKRDRAFEARKAAANGSGRYNSKRSGQGNWRNNSSTGRYRNVAGSRGDNVATGANNIPVRPRPTHLNSRQRSPSSDEAVSSPSESSIISPQPTHPSGNHAWNSPGIDSPRSGSSGRNPIPPKPARLHSKQAVNPANALPKSIMHDRGSSDGSRTPSPPLKTAVIPPKPARLTGKRPAQQSNSTAPAPPTRTIPPKPARLINNKNGPLANATPSPAPAWGIKRFQVTTGSTSRADEDTRSVTSNTTSRWGPVSEGPWGNQGGPITRGNVQSASHNDDDAQSVAPSTTSHWGNVSEGPWRNQGGPIVSVDNEDKPKRSWADEMDDELEETRSRAETEGWDAVSVGPWN